MNLDKYKELLLKKIKSQLTDWFEGDENKTIANSEVYQFLHSTKGTAGTLELNEIFRISENLLEQVKKANQENWERETLKRFLHELMILTQKNQDAIDSAEIQMERSPSENVPLIQVIDDDVSQLIVLKDFFEKKGWMVITSSTQEKAISKYLDLNPDCVIVGENTSKNGFEIIQSLQPYSNKQFVPIIMITPFKDKNTRMNAFKIGADDFLEKPFDFEELAVHIERHLQRKKFFDQSALLDELTKLYNRRYLRVVYHRFSNELRRSGQPFCLAILDLDLFKKVNDQYGHPTGDKVLSRFANLLTEGTRSTDIVFRYGGEEFIILLQNTSDRQAYEIISRVLQDFAKIRFKANGQEFSITFSAGIHMVTNPMSAIADVLNLADQALYKAKESGRARVEYMKDPAADFGNRKLYISIIDDFSVIRMMLTKNLETLKIDPYDIDVEAFKDGPTFLRSFRLNQHGDHFLILDGVMPEMDGLEVLEKVKQMKHSNHVLVMMLTGRNSKTDITRALELGADDYMTKPFNIENLQARIEHLIQRKKNQGFNVHPE